MNERLLIVEDEETLCESLKRVLSREGYIVDISYSAESALDLFEQRFYDLIITDIILPGNTGIELLKSVKEKVPEQIVIITTAYASLETAVEALRAGAYDYVVKPVMHEEIKQIVKNALTQAALQEENLRLRRHIERHYDLSMIIGESAVMRTVIGEVRNISGSGKNVLLNGEIGTGRELIARAIHLNSGRDGKPFIPVNLFTIPEELLEARLFGYVKGAFKDALTSRKGLFEEADGGTLYLRDIGFLSGSLQAKLFRALEDHETVPVGGKQGIKVDMRIVSATSHDIASAVAKEEFRKDLYGLLNGISLRLPPLRERKEDIEPLARHFIRKYSQDLCKPVKELEGEALDLFLRYDWPGNVRELQNIIERAVLISDTDIIRVNHLPQFFPPA
ncbi:MAG TPA: sigma-54 dependent transcriptional regulator [Thermodesulfovibrionales bacterium]|nr:sigma-54 dependent transcriptional regulator [Thermodesulfovibrionales bacterium]